MHAFDMTECEACGTEYMKYDDTDVHFCKCNREIGGKEACYQRGGVCDLCR